MQDGRQLRVIRPDEFSDSWPRVSQLIAPAIPHCNGEFELEDLRNLVESQRAFVVAMEDGSEIILASVCEVRTSPRKQVLNVIILGGCRLNVLVKEFWDRIQYIGRKLGVSAIRGAVRPAMQRYYRRIAPDASVVYAILERKL